MQPAGAILENKDPAAIKAATVLYPNYPGVAAGTSVNFWNYDPQRRGCVGGQVRNGIASEVAGDDPQGGIVRAQAGDGFLDEPAGDGSLTERAAGDDESCGHMTIPPRVSVIAVRPI
jgi:hypothetical protein